MSLLGRIDAVAEPELHSGRTVVRAGKPAGPSVGERLSRGFDRMAGGLSLGIGNRGPIKLLAVPKDPVGGDKAIGEALLRGDLVHGGESVALRSLDFARGGFSPAMFDHLHSFAWLRDLAAAATRDKGGRIAERLVRSWLDACAGGTEHPSWRPDLWGLRILFWTAYVPYLLATRDTPYRTALLTTLVRGARYLDREADRTPAGIGRIAAWSGVLAAALLLQGGVVRLGRAESGLLRALDESLHDDGGLVSRSPFQQLQLVELLGQLRTVYYAARRQMPPRLHEVLSASVGALLGVTLGDEALSSWQSGNMGSRRRLAAAVEGSGVNARALLSPRGWGYHRLAAKGTILIMDGAPPPASRSFGSGCASTLAFEMSDGSSRLIVNCGGSTPWVGALPRELDHALRFTAAHSTLTLGDRNSTAILDEGQLGKGVQQVEILRDANGGTAWIDAVHDGYARRFSLLHRRRLTLESSGRELRGEDRLLPAKKRARLHPTPFAIRFHLAPGVEGAMTADGRGALLRIRGGNAWQFRCQGGSLALEESLWIDESGRPRAASQLVVSGETGEGGATVSWLFHRAA